LVVPQNTEAQEKAATHRNVAMVSQYGTRCPRRAVVVLMDAALAVVVVNAVSPVWGDPPSSSSMLLVVVVVVVVLLLAPSRHEGCGSCARIFLCNAAWTVVRSEDKAKGREAWKNEQKRGGKETPSMEQSGCLPGNNGLAILLFSNGNDVDAQNQFSLSIAY
jgi:hypothetical protein